jgi:5-oxoprolinase (ATP-hydrolysing) subunit A
MGESFGAWEMGADAEILPHVTSINVACGFHAGDPTVMRATAEAATALGVAIGAHPGLPDLIGFGRRTMSVTAADAYDMIVYQVGAMQAVVRAAGSTLRHVKPHGALYNMAAAQPALADAIARAVRDVDSSLVLVGLSGSESVAAAQRAGLRTAREVFADRNYRADGSLVPRSAADALITDIHHAVARALRMVRDQRVRTIDGADIPVTADTICIHGDAPGAAAFAQHIRRALHADGIAVLAPGDVTHS